eukprot:NODE_1252_length_1007_cov_212.208768_g963_i0.p1 GENE.NODE_1252_length_1007_cov_212.208768_g963_i0~~NODE_1252_length_1007_cov_212.208768_g963_i0.p1  ORF type:complete len:269 (-),score=65.08 NODE_1252_length_1007_cov_212.208768_g963_i0:128-934(-)
MADQLTVFEDDVRTACMEIGKLLEIEESTAQQLGSRPLPSVRNALKKMLTCLRVDPPESVLRVIDRILQHELQDLKVTDAAELFVEQKKAVVWRGDITTLKVDAIVNAANSAMLGCFRPNHPCIDNAIHCRAGPQLRAACRELMSAQNSPEPTGKAKITPAFNLPSRFVLHTVGPIVEDKVTAESERLLASSYTHCLDLAQENNLSTVAFCCISTGVFGYPQLPAAHLALRTVRDWLAAHPNTIDGVVFNVFLESDLAIYTELLPTYF